METVYGEIPTDVDECWWCGTEIDHDCVRVVGRTGSYRDFDMSCWEKRKYVFKENEWTITKYVLNADRK